MKTIANDSPRTLGDTARSVARFAMVSGTGLLIDVGLFLLLAYAIRAGAANFISAAVAVTFVYFASVKRIFSYHGRFLMPLFCVYLAYQTAAVALASLAVDLLVQAGSEPLLAKMIILPITFSANYLFMSFLTRRGKVS